MTLREIAEAAGISIGTVDRVLHDRGRVSASTKAKVETIIRDSSYKPNMAARQLKLNRPYNFACLIPSLGEDSGYWRIVYAGVQKAARELAPFRVSIKKIEFDRYSESSFHEHIQQLFSAEFDSLLMAPVLPEASMALLHRLPADFPVMFFDAQLPGYSPISRIGQNAFQSGTLAGRMLDALATRKGTYCVISTHAEDFHIQKRVEGFLSYFASIGAKRNIGTFQCFDIEHKEKREFFLRQLLRKHPDVDGIFVTNASAHRVATFVNEDADRHIATVGYDLVPENARQLKAGLLDVVLSQRPEYQGYESVYQLYSHVVLQQEIEREIIVPIEIFMKENLPVEVSPAT